MPAGDPFRLRTMGEEEFAPYDGGGEGLYHRFFHAVSAGKSVEEILELAKTKRYPMARLRRLMLHSYLQIRQAEPGETPPYLRVLGANERGRKLLRRMASEASLPVVVRPAAARTLGQRPAYFLIRRSAVRISIPLRTLSWGSLYLEVSALPVR